MNGDDHPDRGAKTTYTVRAERSGRWWALQCVEAPGAISQVRRLGEVEECMREAIQMVTGEQPDRIDIAVQVDLPAEACAHWEAAQALRAESDRAKHEAAVEARRAAKALREAGLTIDEIGQCLGVSRQRAHQLIA